MTRVAGAGAAAVALLLATPVAALPIIPPQHLCGCSLVELAPELPVNAPDPGYDPALSLGEIAALKAIDDQHEPMPEPALWAWICLPTLPKVPGRPGTPDQHMGGGDAPGGAGQPGEIDTRSVPEPSGIALLAIAAFALHRRSDWRRRPTSPRSCSRTGHSRHRSLSVDTL